MKNVSKKQFLLNYAFVMGLLILGCYPVSHIVVGDVRESINYSDVKVYADFPNRHEKIAIIEASSNFAFKDIAFDFSDQAKTDRALKRIKKEAALLGANGIVIEDLSTTVKQKQDFYSDGKGEIIMSSHEEKEKDIKAIAIFVRE